MSTSPPFADNAARHAVGVADGHRDNRPVGGHRVPQPVREPVPRPEPLHVGDAGLHGHRRAQRHPVGELRRRRHAVHGDAAAHEVEAGAVRVLEQRGRVGRVDEVERHAGVSEVVEHGVEPVELLGGVRVAGLVGDGEVGEHALEAQLVARRDRLGQPARVGGGAPDPVHPGVDLEVHRERFGARVGDRLGEGVDAGGRVRDGREAEGDDGGGGGAAAARTARGRGRRCRRRAARRPPRRARPRATARRRRARRAPPAPRRARSRRP